MELVPRRAVYEPDFWVVVFHRRSVNWVFSLIAMGRFKHVSAFGWVPGLNVWLLYDHGYRRTQVAVLPDTEAAKAELAVFVGDGAMVRMPVRQTARRLRRVGLFCTTSVAHLIGLSSGALRPDRLFRHCMENGGVLIDHAKTPRADG